MNAHDTMRLALLPFAIDEITALSTAETEDAAAQADLDDAISNHGAALQAAYDTDLSIDVMPPNALLRWSQHATVEGERAQLTLALAVGRMARARRRAESTESRRAHAFDRLRDRAVRGE